MNPPAHAPQPQRPPPKSGRGCLIALAIFGGVIVLGVVGMVVGIVMFAKSADGKKIIGIVGEGIEITQESLNAPGTSELRALGCEQAMVMDLEKFVTMASKYADAAVDGGTGKFRLMVTCQKRIGSAPSCADVASTYVKAVGTPAGRFAVTVQRSGGARQCSRLYDVDGTDLGEVK